MLLLVFKIFYDVLNITNIAPNFDYFVLFLILQVLPLNLALTNHCKCGRNPWPKLEFNLFHVSFISIFLYRFKVKEKIISLSPVSLCPFSTSPSCSSVPVHNTQPQKGKTMNPLGI